MTATAAGDLADRYEALVDGARVTFGRAPTWARDEAWSPAPHEFTGDVIAVVAWFPGDLLSEGDSVSSWEIYDWEPGWQSGVHGGGPGAIAPAGVDSVIELAAAVARRLGQPVELRPCAQAIGMRGPRDEIAWLWFPVFTVERRRHAGPG